MIKNIIPDLADVFKEDNKKFFNLLEKRNWDTLIQEVENGRPIEELIEELVDGKWDDTN